MPKIHKATIWEVAKLWKLFQTALATDFNYFSKAHIDSVRRQNSLPRLIAALIHRNRVLLVASLDRQLVGFAIGAVPRPGEGELYWLFVDPNHRGQNIGLKLLAASFKAMRHRRAHKVRIVTYDIDRYYHRQGFEYAGTQMIDGLELKIMEFPLLPDHTSRRPGYVRPLLLTLLLVMLAAAALTLPAYRPPSQPTKPAQFSSVPGRVLKIIENRHYSAAEVGAIVNQNYAGSLSSVKDGATRVLFTYSSLDLANQPITIYARAYLPDNHASAPIFALAPGTTGIGDECAASLEQPEIHNWANYQSHALAYTSQGYATVVTDYEGMRDPNRLHHYMIGQLEGRAVLDSIRALKKLPVAQPIINPSQVLVGGYSQGGHSAFWADKINSNYAPDVTISGVIGWGPVMDVKQTWQDITKGANINWFGPYVLVSYSDFYKANYQPGNILLPPWQTNLLKDVTSHCIDSDIQFWGRAPARIYQPQFLSDLGTGNLPSDRYGSLEQALNANIVGDQTTPTFKLINYGDLDNVVLPSQQTNAKARLCSNSRGPVSVTAYSRDTHYTVMKSSFQDTLDWMKKALSHAQTLTSCGQTAP